MGRPKKQRVNDFRGLDIQKASDDWLFEYQRAGLYERQDRFLLKSRQIGASLACAWEALKMSAQNAENFVFVSASRNQVGVIRQYLFDLAEEHFNVKLTGKEKTRFLSVEGKPTYLVWCSTNVYTAQSYNGNLIVDEACWIPNFKELARVAFPMSTLGNYFIKLMSTPSYKGHYSYRLWDSEDQNLEFKKQIITIYDAINGGNHLIDLEKIKKRFSKRDFKSLYECCWVDNSSSIFKEDDLKKCFYTEFFINEAGDKIEEYASLPKFKPGSNPVYVGYDPNGGTTGGDESGLIVLEHLPNGILRVLDHVCFSGQSPDAQYARIKNKLKPYMSQIKLMSIDKSGPGARLYERVLALKHETGWNAKMVGLEYNYENKNLFAWNVEKLVSDARFEFESTDKKLILSFMSVVTRSTGAGRITVASKREGNSHGELFWALANVCSRINIADSFLKTSRQNLSYDCY